MASKLHLTLYNSRNETGDVTFDTGIDQIRAHKCVLATVSKTFKDYFFGADKPDGSVIIESNGPSTDAFNAFIEFCYFGNVKFLIHRVEAIYSLAKKWGVNDCVTKCESFIKGYLVEGATLLSFYRLAITRNWENVQQLCESEIIHDTSKVLRSGHILSCDREMLAKILSLRPLNCSTIEVMKACISWAKAVCRKENQDDQDPKTLRNTIGDLINLIRFHSMTIEDFYSLNKEYDGIFTPFECILIEEVCKRPLIDVDVPIKQEPTIKQESLSDAESELIVDWESECLPFVADVSVKPESPDSNGATDDESEMESECKPTPKKMFKKN